MLRFSRHTTASTGLRSVRSTWGGLRARHHRVRHRAYSSHDRNDGGGERERTGEQETLKEKANRHWDNLWIVRPLVLSGALLGVYALVGGQDESDEAQRLVEQGPVKSSWLFGGDDTAATDDALAGDSDFWSTRNENSDGLHFPSNEPPYGPDACNMSYESRQARFEFIKDGVKEFDAKLTLGSLVGVNVLIHAAKSFAPPHSPLEHMFRKHFFMSVENVFRGRWHTMLTSAFTHGGLAHLAFNMIALYTIGSHVHEAMGRSNFLGLYFGGAMASSALSLAAKLATQTRIPSVGASGAVWAVAASSVLLQPTTKYSIIIFPFYSFSGDQLIPALFAADLFGLFLYPAIAKRASPFDHAGHLGGAIFGGLFFNWVGRTRGTGENRFRLLHGMPFYGDTFMFIPTRGVFLAPSFEYIGEFNRAGQLNGYGFYRQFDDDEKRRRELDYDANEIQLEYGGGVRPHDSVERSLWLHGYFRHNSTHGYGLAHSADLPPNTVMVVNRDDPDSPAKPVDRRHFHLRQINTAPGNVSEVLARSAKDEPFEDSWIHSALGMDSRTHPIRPKTGQESGDRWD